jgi:hypothetical protein
MTPEEAARATALIEGQDAGYIFQEDALTWAYTFGVTTFGSMPDENEARIIGRLFYSNIQDAPAGSDF